MLITIHRLFKSLDFCISYLLSLGSLEMDGFKATRSTTASEATIVVVSTIHTIVSQRNTTHPSHGDTNLGIEFPLQLDIIFPRPGTTIVQAPQLRFQLLLWWSDLIYCTVSTFLKRT